LRFEGENATVTSDLYQTGQHRKMVQRWTFDGPDKYRETLLEALGEADLTFLAAWDHTRSDTPIPAPLRSAVAPLKPSTTCRTGNQVDRPPSYKLPRDVADGMAAMSWLALQSCRSTIGPRAAAQRLVFPPAGPNFLAGPLGAPALHNRRYHHGVQVGHERC
jgi:hypothetical protein